MVLYADVHGDRPFTDNRVSPGTVYHRLLHPIMPLLPVNRLDLLDEPNLKLLDALPDEADEPLPFFGQGFAVLLE